MLRGVAEPQQRHGRDDAGADEKDRQPPVGAAKSERVRFSKINEKNDGQWKQQDRFDEQTGDGGGAGLFAEQSVESERDAKQNGDPGEAAVTESEIQSSQSGQ